MDRIEILCDTFEISLTDFFKENDDDEFISLTDAQKEMLQKWSHIQPNQRRALLTVIDLLLSEDENS